MSQTRLVGLKVNKPYGGLFFHALVSTRSDRDEEMQEGITAQGYGEKTRQDRGGVCHGIVVFLCFFKVKQPFLKYFLEIYI